ncbi:type II secretion system protein [bacterium]|nr:type II secretion system protein [bacterium]
MFKKTSKNKGFTLIEILAVVAIIGILSAVTVMYLNAARSKGRDASRKGALRQIENAIIIFADNNNGNYPDNLVNLVPEYMPKVPQDPKTNTVYSYNVSDDKNRYELNANLEINIDNSADIDGGNEPFPVYEVGSDLKLLP